VKKIVRKLFFGFGFWLLASGFSFSQTIDSAECFFDTDPGVGNGMPVAVTPGDSIFDSVYVNTTGVSTGFHNIFFRVKDTNGIWSLYEAGHFFIYDTTVVTSASFDSSSGEYFFDTDLGVDSGTALLFSPGDTIMDTFLVSTTGLASGFHNFFFRAKDSNNVWSLYEWGGFYLYDTITQTPPSSYPISAGEYFYDTDPGIGNGISIVSFSPADSILLTDTLPTAPLTAGTHYLFLRVLDTMNVWSLYEWQSFVICYLIPMSDFTTDTVCLNSATTFTDLTTNLDTNFNYTYSWDFDGDGFTDDTTKGNTTYTFPSIGTHTVSLIVNNTNGCVDTIVKTVYVDSLPTVTLNFPIDTFCHDDTILLSGGNPAGGIYSGNGVYNNAFFADSVSTGIHTIAYTYYNIDSCSSTVYAAIFVSPCTGIDEFTIHNLQFTVSPNPFRETTTLEVIGYQLSVIGFEFKIYDVFGREVLQLPITGYRLLINRGNLASGFYFFKLASKREIIGTGKLVITD